MDHPYGFHACRGDVSGVIGLTRGVRAARVAEVDSDIAVIAIVT